MKKGYWKDRYFVDQGRYTIKCGTCNEYFHGGLSPDEPATNVHELCLGARTNGWRLSKFSTHCDKCKYRIFRCWTANAFRHVGQAFRSIGGMWGRYVSPWI